eukprot:TRINITY_DN1123_c2_g1_i2.p1 TRINITY_DN1123_c2_g1~~TRINITY_DN1123_c2_g1_i2.p1  ORF type:complete len:415 (-),score=80.59 TRINITY_DN1123_c2_g1_i2:405-1649(-)
MMKVADVLESRLDEFAQAESRDQGKPVWLARAVDIPRAVANFRFYATAILHEEEMSTVTDALNCVNYTQKVPVGVGGLISPWNLPLYLLTWKIAPCIAVGNACVCKPSEVTPMTAFLLCDVIKQAGLPDGVVNMVFGTGPGAGAALVQHPNVPLISFTGGTQTGEVITKLAAPLCKKLSLELGGKNANVVFEDALLDDCVTTSLRSSFANQGEICLCGSRIFVQRSIFDEFVKRFVEATKALTVGDPKGDSKVGALVSEAHLAKVKSYIDLAKEEGGTVECGGTTPADLPENLKGGYYLTPCIITGLSPTCRVQQEEIFGPVVTVTPFDTEDEVISLANNVRFGLAASVWTENARRAHRVALQIDAGYVWVNCWLQRDLRVPFGGLKQSGVGREGGKYSLDFYTETKVICMKYV